ncbi:MAG: ABC transporter permease [Deltaproteobacteria bacterium]|jgi:peptide/nickel transport system permease protein|nr:ABC transporter permease [Deltaproteobacteria bacterium]
MLRFVSIRLLSIVATLFAASFLIFAISQLLPGDVAQMVLGQNATPEALAQLRLKMGLDQPWLARYLAWLGGVLRGDLGESLMAPGVMVSQQLALNARASLVLAGAATVFVIPLALLFGCLAGLNQDNHIDRLISIMSIFAISLPEFVSATFLIIIFSLKLGLFPSASLIDTSASIIGQFRSLVLPVFTLSLVLSGYVARMTRASVIETNGQPYIRAAVLKGLSRRRVIVSHVLRNALLPTVTVIAMNIGWLVGGLVVVETVFSYPGLGSLLMTGIIQRDVPLIQGAALVIVAGYMVFNLLADIIYRLLNPRLRGG